MATKKGNGKSGKKSTAGKQTTARKSSGGSSARSKRTAVSASGSGRTGVYLLTILVLLTVIVLLANRLFFSGEERPRTAGKIIEELAVDRKTVDTEKKETVGDKKDAEKKSDETAVTEPVVQESHVKIYLLGLDERTEKILLKPVKRRIHGEPTLRASLEELIKGPTADERRKGYLSAIPGNLRVRSVTMRGDIAEIDFNGAIEEGATGSILLSRMDQIIYTATEKSGVKSIVITVNGARKKFIGADGLSISGPLQRRY